MKRLLVALGIVVALIITFIALNMNANKTEDTTTTTPEPVAETLKWEDITNPENPELELVLVAGETEYNLKFELFPEYAPQSVDNMISLANSGFYDGLSMHRLVKDFVLQGGDPDGTGAGGPGYAIKGEFSANGIENNLTHDVGAIAWARAEAPDSAGSQFYIVSGANGKQLDGSYAVFGFVTSGLDAIEEINSKIDDAGLVDGQPLTIKSAKVDTKGKTYEEPTKLTE